MNRYIVDEFYRNPALLRRLSGEARRDRNRAIRASLGWLRRHLVPRFDFRPTQWMERLG